MRFAAACWLSLALAAAPAPSAPAAGPPALDALLAAFAKAPGLQADFVEEKHMSLLAAPLRTEGTLYFDPPGRLARHTTKPAPSILLVEPHRVRFGDDHGVETIDLGARPVVKLFVESFTEILRGDRAALERLYTITLSPGPSGADGAWAMTLRPRVSPMNKVFDRLEITGQGVVVSEMVMVEKGGDRTVTRFSAVDANRRFTPEERARWFTVPSP